MAQIDHILFFCSPMGHLDSFHFLAILSHVALCIHMQVFFAWMYIYVYPEYTPRSEIAGFYGLFLEKEMATHSSILAWRTHGWKSLVGYSPQGRKESDTTERLHFMAYF